MSTRYLVLLIITLMPLSGTSLVSASEPINISAQLYEFDYAKNLITAEGEVRITYKDITIEASRIEFDYDRGLIEAYENIILTKGEERIEGDILTYDLKSEKAHLRRANTVIDKVFLSGDKIEITEHKATINRGEFTTCDLASPHYHLSADRVIVYPEDRLIARNVVFWIGNFPILWMPYYITLLKEEGPRRGFVPDVGYNKKDGLYIAGELDYLLSLNSYGSVNLKYTTRRGWRTSATHHYGIGSLGVGKLVLYYNSGKKEIEGESWGVAIDHKGTFPKGGWRIYYKYNLDRDLVTGKEKETVVTRDHISLREGNYNLTILHSLNEDLSPNNDYLLDRKPELTLSLIGLERIEKAPLLYWGYINWGYFQEDPPGNIADRTELYLKLSSDPIWLSSKAQFSFNIDHRDGWYHKSDGDIERRMIDSNGIGLTTNLYGPRAILNLNYSYTYIDGKSPFWFDSATMLGIENTNLLRGTLSLGGDLLSNGYKKWEGNVNASYDFLLEEYSDITSDWIFRPDLTTNLRMGLRYGLIEPEDEEEEVWRLKSISAGVGAISEDNRSYIGLLASYDTIDSVFSRIRGSTGATSEDDKRAISLLAEYDAKEHRIDRVIGRLRVQGEHNWSLSAKVDYDPSRSSYKGVEPELGLWVGKWRLSFSAKYNHIKDIWDETDWILVRDLHCWEAKLKWHTKKSEDLDEITLSFILKAYPEQRIEIPLEFREEGLQLPELPQL